MNSNDFFIIRGSGDTWQLKYPNFKDSRIIDSKTDYQKYWNKIKNGENFMFMREADGERMLMRGQEIHAQEGWTAPPKLTALGRALQATLTFTPPPWLEIFPLFTLFLALVVVRKTTFGTFNTLSHTQSLHSQISG